jgi:curved DNA-binding protein CbpA
VPDETDFYAMLRVDPRASTHEIHAAYRALAREIHPDLTGEDDAMKRVNVAWDTLREPFRRSKYDAARGHGPSVAEPVVAGPPSRPARPGDRTGGGPEAAFVMTYGRYEGWSLGEIAQVDRPFLEWLRSVPGGRGLRSEIDAVLADLDRRPGTAGARRQAAPRFGFGG